VKQFCPVEAKNLTRPHTSGGLWASRIAPKIGFLAVLTRHAILAG
jgi:hypothetical protein